MHRARATQQVHSPIPSCPSSPKALLPSFRRRLPLLAPLALAGPPPAFFSRAASPSPSPSPSPPMPCSSARWGPPVPWGAGAGGSLRPSSRAFCTAETASGGQREGKELLVQHLLVGEKDVRLLIDLEKSIISGGADLSDLAVEYSLCPSKENGGMLGWIRRGQMVPEFEVAAFSAPLNKVVRCKTKFGWHLLQVLSEREQCVLEDIGPEELHGKMQEPSFIEEAQLIDVREPDEVAKASLPGFKVLPLRQFGTWGPVMTDEFDPQKDTYVLCHHGMRSMQVAKWLQSQGFRKVFNVAGGIHAFAVKADPSIPTY